MGERPRGEPTPAVITAVLAQTATTSDHGSIEPVLAAHLPAVWGFVRSPQRRQAGAAAPWLVSKAS